MVYLYMVLTILGLWAASVGLGVLYGARFEKDEFYNKIKANCNNIFYCTFGIVGIAIAFYFFDLLKWLVLAYYSFTAIVAVFYLITGVTTQIIADVHDKTIEKWAWIVYASNFLSLCADIVIILGGIFICIVK